MAKIREGSRSVLLVVDVQVGVMRQAWDSARVVNNVALAVDRARAQGAPVLWVQHADDEMPRGSEDWQWVPELMPGAGEPVLHKHFNSAFEDSGLESELDRLAATHIILAGASTNWCIRATAHAALERGYDLTVVKDAHTTSTMNLEGGIVVEAETVIREFNIAMTWLSYPGRTNRTMRAEELDFAASPDRR